MSDKVETGRPEQLPPPPTEKLPGEGGSRLRRHGGPRMGTAGDMSWGFALGAGSVHWPLCHGPEMHGARPTVDMEHSEEMKVHRVGQPRVGRASGEEGVADAGVQGRGPRQRLQWRTWDVLLGRQVRTCWRGSYRLCKGLCILSCGQWGASSADLETVIHTIHPVGPDIRLSPELERRNHDWSLSRSLGYLWREGRKKRRRNGSQEDRTEGSLLQMGARQQSSVGHGGG